MTGGSTIASRRSLSARTSDYDISGGLAPMQRMSRFASRYPPPGFPSLSGTRLRPRSAFSSRSFDLADDLDESFISSQLFEPSSPDWNESAHSPYLGMGSQMGDPLDSSAYLNDEGVGNWRGECVEETAMGALVTNYGIMSVRLHDGVRVDLTVDKAIRILNYQSNIILALGSNGASAALIHPSGSVYQYGSRVEITTPDPVGNTKFAKMWYKGVSFTSEKCALVYLVDQAGTRTTTDTFSDMGGDFSMPVFLSDSYFGPSAIEECIQILRGTQYWLTEEGVENWIINGIRISQTADGLVRVGRGTSKYQLRTSPSNGTASLTTPFVHATASIGVPTPNNAGAPHLFVKRGERRMHCDGKTFIVRNAGHSAGFDELNQLKVY